jgi:hypothetical protein
MFLPLIPTVLGVHVLIAAAGGVPHVNMENNCRVSEKTLKDMFGDSLRGDVFESCMTQEGAAREEILKNWATYPAADRAHCIQPTAYMPSYVEWITCFEIARDVRKMRKEQPASAMDAVPPKQLPAASQLKPRTGSKTNLCPVVQFREDGSIASMKAC